MAFLPPLRRKPWQFRGNSRIFRIFLAVSCVVGCYYTCSNADRCSDAHGLTLRPLLRAAPGSCGSIREMSTQQLNEKMEKASQRSDGSSLLAYSAATSELNRRQLQALQTTNYYHLGATAILAVGMLGLCTYLFVFRKSAVKDENTHLISGPRDSTVDPNSPGYQALLNAMDNTASKVKKIMARDHKSDSTLKSMPYSEPQG
ncbi:hypothetical protein AAMO2058_001543100 [Amorphochlora amoebiformis]